MSAVRSGANLLEIHCHGEMAEPRPGQPHQRGHGWEMPLWLLGNLLVRQMRPSGAQGLGAPRLMFQPHLPPSAAASAGGLCAAELLSSFQGVPCECKPTNRSSSKAPSNSIGECSFGVLNQFPSTLSGPGLCLPGNYVANEDSRGYIRRGEAE